MKQITSIQSPKFLLLATALVFLAASVFVTGAKAQERANPCESAPSGKCRTCNEFTFDASKSFDPSKKKISVLWDFGDGSTSDKTTVKHVYEKSGDYVVTLTVKNDSGLPCDTAVTSQTVKVNMPPKAAFLAAQTACSNEAVVFDASSSEDDNAGDLSYVWDFGDGTKDEGKRVTKTFEKGGTYSVRLTVDDGANTPCSTDSTTKTIKINTPPRANAGEGMNLCFSPSSEMKVTLDGSASSDPDGDALTYQWDLGDGAQASEKKITHTYAAPGSYTARLSVDDGSGSSCGSDSAPVQLSLNRSPIANAGDDVTACLGNEIRFDGTGSTSEAGRPLNYEWSFGDGETAEGATVAHAYAKGGNYRATLKVDDGSGSRCATSTDVKNVFIGAPPVAHLADVPQACAGERVTLDASGTQSGGGTLKYTWDFGDGTIEPGGARVTHVYAKGGRYPVRVSVEKVAAGAPCESPEALPCARDTVSTTVVVNTPPIADAGPNLVCCVGKESVFDGANSADADGGTLNYSWDFGDGGTAEGMRATHVYDKPGSYKVTLTVDDGTGSKCSSSQSSFVANVSGQPVALIDVNCQ